LLKKEKELTICAIRLPRSAQRAVGSRLKRLCLRLSRAKDIACRSLDCRRPPVGCFHFMFAPTGRGCPSLLEWLPRLDGSIVTLRTRCIVSPRFARAPAGRSKPSSSGWAGAFPWALQHDTHSTGLPLQTLPMNSWRRAFATTLEPPATPSKKSPASAFLLRRIVHCLSPPIPHLGAY